MEAIVTEAAQSLIRANNVLMKGDNFDGSFVNFPGVDIMRVSKFFTSLLKAHVVNALWKAQKVFILGGGACGDNQGIGAGPQEASYCHNGKAWYLYYLKPLETSPPVLIQKPLRVVGAPPGLENLGQGVWPSLNATDVIRSSVAAYEDGNYNFTSHMKDYFAMDAIRHGADNIIKNGLGVKGIFTIPVCDIGHIVYTNNACKKHTLAPYESLPTWSTPKGMPLRNLCSGSFDQTKKFFKAANMKDDIDSFSGPLGGCVSRGRRICGMVYGSRIGVRR